MQRSTAVAAGLITLVGVVAWWASTRSESAYVGTMLAELARSRVGPAPRLERAARHPMRYYVTLPHDWHADGTWPVVVTLDGADRDFRWNHAAFVRARSDRPFIVVTPLILSNGGRIDHATYPYTPAVWNEVARAGADGPIRFDEAGVLAVLDDVRARFGGAPRAFLAGYSAGGHAMWVLALRHPERFVAVAAASANFAARGLTLPEPTPVPNDARTRLPIRAFFGTRDRRKSVLEAQWQAAATRARAANIAELSREDLRGWGHGPFAAQAFAFFIAHATTGDTTQ